MLRRNEALKPFVAKQTSPANAKRRDQAGDLGCLPLIEVTGIFCVAVVTRCFRASLRVFEIAAAICPRCEVAWVNARWPPWPIHNS
jgi:hypothetical protein